jgi:hypothetical protein
MKGKEAGERFTRAGNGSSQIDLQGDLKKGKTRSSIEPIVAYLSPQGVDVTFNQIFGIVEIVITNSLGNTVYQTSVDTELHGYFLIPEEYFSNGDTYTIQFTCTYGEKHGTFIWEEL